MMFLYRDDYYNSDSEKRNIAECIVAKNRHGGNRQGGAAVAAGIHLLRHPGKPLSGGELMDLRPFVERWHMLPPRRGRCWWPCPAGGTPCACCTIWPPCPRDFSVAAAHLDHGQRPTAGRDVAFVEELCRSWTFP